MTSICFMEICWLLLLLVTECVYCVVRTETFIMFRLILLFKEVIFHEIELDHVFQACEQCTVGKQNRPVDTIRHCDVILKHSIIAAALFCCCQSHQPTCLSIQTNCLPANVCLCVPACLPVFQPAQLSLHMKCSIYKYTG